MLLMLFAVGNNSQKCCTGQMYSSKKTSKYTSGENNDFYVCVMSSWSRSML